MPWGRRNPEKEAARAAERAEKDDQKRASEEEGRRRAFLRTPVGRARTAYEAGDRVFQYSHDVMSQQAIVIAMVGGKTKATSADPSEILNAVCHEGWDLVNGSFVFVEEGQESRDKFMSSGQNVAVKGTTVGYYLFRRYPENRAAAVAK
jgi:hypothetical protein